MKGKIWLFWLSLLALLVLFLTGCNLEGVAGFSAGSDRAAVVRNANTLYTTNESGGDAATITTNLQSAFSVTFNPQGTRLLFATADSQICLASATGVGTPTCEVTIPAGVSVGFLSYLPSGDVIFVYQDPGTDKFEMRIYNPAWNVIRNEGNLDQFFLTTDAYKVKRGTNGAQWRLEPHGRGMLRWVVTRGEDAFEFTASSSGIGGPNPLPVRISSAVQQTLAQRDLRDITSGAVAPDGRTLVFRTGSEGSLYNLYTMDLYRSDGHFERLVESANFRIQYAFSPDGRELAYESNAGGRSVWLADANGQNKRQLATGASLPDWRD